MSALAEFAARKLDELSQQDLHRALVATHRMEGAIVRRGPRELVSFSCNDYLGLSQHPDVKHAAMAAVETYGAGAGASRLVTGDNLLVRRLEERLAQFKGAQAACLFGSGYLANIGVIPALAGAQDVILADELAHACIWAGAKLSGARTLAFRHNDPADLEEKLGRLRGAARFALVATEGVFSMDGDLAPLDRIGGVCRQNDAWLLVDDAHGFGVVGDGRGSGALFPDAQVDLAVGTLSKALGAYGAYVCAEQPVIDLIRNRARSFVYTTGLPPACAAAALASLDIVEAEPQRCAAPVTHARRFSEALGLAPSQSAIVPLVLGEAREALTAAAQLEEAGLLVVAIRPPTVPPGTARLRVSFSAAHAEGDVARLVEAVSSLTKKIGARVPAPVA